MGFLCTAESVGSLRSYDMMLEEMVPGTEVKQDFSARRIGSNFVAGKVSPESSLRKYMR